MICTVMPDIVQQCQQQHLLTFRIEQPHDFEIEALTSAAVDKVTITDLSYCTGLQCFVLSQTAGQTVYRGTRWGCSSLGSWLQGWSQMCGRHVGSHLDRGRCMSL